ncbi:MAG: cysteine dioxygenase [Burkholderiaceae bacterium]|nr:cysteine dioxygenase [Burkholderiaceae bacterium]
MTQSANGGTAVSGIAKLDRFTGALGALIDRTSDQKQPEFLEQVSVLLADLVKTDDWLPQSHAVPHPQYYQQYCLHVDPQQRFSVVSFVWGPGQATPVHDHTIWGVIGMLRGTEHSQRYVIGQGGVPTAEGPLEVLSPGDTSIVSAHHGDVHKVMNAHQDRVSISIHVYGGDIGSIKRHVYPLEGGPAKDFISGYSVPAAKH